MSRDQPPAPPGLPAAARLSGTRSVRSVGGGRGAGRGAGLPGGAVRARTPALQKAVQVRGAFDASDSFQEASCVHTTGPCRGQTDSFASRVARPLHPAPGPEGAIRFCFSLERAGQLLRDKSRGQKPLLGAQFPVLLIGRKPNSRRTHRLSPLDYFFCTGRAWFCYPGCARFVSLSPGALPRLRLLPNS